MEQEEGKAIPDWMYVKTELLQSSFNADVLLAEYIMYKRLDDFNQAKKWILDLFFKLENKTDLKKKEYKILEKIDLFVEGKEKLDFLEWRECLKALNKKLDDLGVTRIEMPPTKKMKHPLLSG